MIELLRKTGMVAISLTALVILLEIGFRVSEFISSLSDNQESDSWAIYDQDLLYRPRPNYDDFNALGLRNTPVSRDKTRFRLLLLGDSIPFYGGEVSDTYPGRLAISLNNDPELMPTEVVNAGIKGYTNYQELIFLKKFGLNLKPDLVGVSFCLNDLHQFLHQFRIEDGEIVGDTYQLTEEAVKSVDSAVFRLARKSHFLLWLRHRLTVFEQLVQLKSAEGFTFDYRPDFSTAWHDRPWTAIEQQLAAMNELGRAHDFRVFLVAFPFGEQYRKDYLKKDRAYVLKPQRQLRAICARLDIPFLDLYEFLDREKHLEADGIHLTQSGRQQVAVTIADFLKEKRLVLSSKLTSKSNGEVANNERSNYWRRGLHRLSSGRRAP